MSNSRDRARATEEDSNSLSLSLLNGHHARLLYAASPGLNASCIHRRVEKETEKKKFRKKKNYAKKISSTKRYSWLVR